MKKLLSIFLLIIYTWSAFGAVSIVSQKCNGLGSHISFLKYETQSHCKCASDNMPKDCCKDHVICQKVDIHKTLQESFTLNTISFAPDLLAVSTIFNLYVQDVSYNVTDIKTSSFFIKRSSPQPIYLLFRVFRI